MVVGVNDVELALVCVVSLVAVALVSIKIDNAEPLNLVPFLQVVSDERDIWIDAEPTAGRPSGMVEAPTKVNGPSMFERHAGSINTALRRAHKRLQDSPSEHPVKQRNRKLDRLAYKKRVV